MDQTSLAFTKLWHFIDAESASVGRLASRISLILQGKTKPIYNPITDCGDYVVVKNAKNLVLTGRKTEQKEYIHHTGYPGGLKRTPITKFLENDPGEIIKRAVRGMLPKNRLRKGRMERLKIFNDNGPTPYDANQHKNYLANDDK